MLSIWRCIVKDLDDNPSGIKQLYMRYFEEARTRFSRMFKKIYGKKDFKRDD